VMCMQSQMALWESEQDHWVFRPRAKARQGSKGRGDIYSSEATDGDAICMHDGANGLIGQQ